MRARARVPAFCSSCHISSPLLPSKMLTGLPWKRLFFLPSFSLLFYISRNPSNLFGREGSGCFQPCATAMQFVAALFLQRTAGTKRDGIVLAYPTSAPVTLACCLLGLNVRVRKIWLRISSGHFCFGHSTSLLWRLKQELGIVHLSLKIIIYIDRKNTAQESNKCDSIPPPRLPPVAAPSLLQCIPGR